MSLAQRIVDEISGKIEDFETNSSKFMDSVGEWGELFAVRPPRRRSDRTFSNPRLTEFFRATNALGTMMYRMQTASDPFFEVVPMSPLKGNDQLLDIQAVLELQLQASRYRQNLLVADMGVCAFGTQIVEENFEVVGVNPWGRRIPTTTFRPRSLFQIAFERGTTDIESADWVSSADLASDATLMGLAANADASTAKWNKQALEHAAKEEAKTSTLSVRIQTKLSKQGFVSGQDKALRKELVSYYGKLDCVNDGLEYICALVNRKYLVRFQPNKNQTGQRNFRVARWVIDPMTMDPMGMGLGSIGSGLHHSLDANRQKAQDSISIASYGMWQRLRSAGIDDNDLKLRPLSIIDSDERDGISPLKTDLKGADAALKLEELLRAEFKAATGATDTLQAIVTGATASEVSLAQNESVRAVGVRSEMVAEPFVREHLVTMHINNIENLKKPMSINRAGIARQVYPVQMRLDADFKLKISNDQSFKPQRLEKLMQLLQTLVSTKSAFPEAMQISVIPIVEEIARCLGVPASDVIQKQGVEIPPQMQGQMMQRMGGGQVGGGMQSAPMTNTMQTIQTPVGDVVGSPT